MTRHYNPEPALLPEYAAPQPKQTTLRDEIKNIIPFPTIF
jgi:hypothetical protein